MFDLSLESSSSQEKLCRPHQDPGGYESFLGSFNLCLIGKWCTWKAIGANGPTRRTYWAAGNPFSRRPCIQRICRFDHSRIRIRPKTASGCWTTPLPDPRTAVFRGRVRRRFALWQREHIVDYTRCRRLYGRGATASSFLAS